MRIFFRKSFDTQKKEFGVLSGNKKGKKECDEYYKQARKDYKKSSEFENPQNIVVEGGEARQCANLGCEVPVQHFFFQICAKMFILLVEKNERNFWK